MKKVQNVGTKCAFMPILYNIQSIKQTMAYVFVSYKLWLMFVSYN